MYSDQWVERFWPGVKQGNFPGNLNNLFLVATPQGLQALPNAAQSMLRKNTAGLDSQSFVETERSS